MSITTSDLVAAAVRLSNQTTICDHDLLEAARDHGMLPLLYQALYDRGSLDHQPADLRRSLAEAVRQAAISELIQRDALVRLLSALRTEGVRPLLFKGSAAAYSYYPAPWLRPRLDTDLLIRERDRIIVHRVLTRLGFRRRIQTMGEHVVHQAAYVAAPQGVAVTYDIHWKVCDPLAFANLLTYDELAESAVAIPALGPDALSVNDVHALVVALIHRVAHHYDSPRLIWLWDIDLLARRLDNRSWDRLVDVARSKRTSRVMSRGLSLSARFFETPVPQRVVRALKACAEQEPTVDFLDPALRRVDILLSDLRTSPTWNSRFRLLREHLLPPASYVLDRYGRPARVLVPALYVRRAVSGAAAWFRAIRTDI